MQNPLMQSLFGFLNQITQEVKGKKEIFIPLEIKFKKKVETEELP